MRQRANANCGGVTTEVKAEADAAGMMARRVCVWEGEEGGHAQGRSVVEAGEGRGNEEKGEVAAAKGGKGEVRGGAEGKRAATAVAWWRRQRWCSTPPGAPPARRVGGRTRWRRVGRDALAAALGGG